MSKKNKKPNDNRTYTNYGQPDVDTDKVDDLPSDEDVADPEIEVKPDDAVKYVPSSLVYSTEAISPSKVTFRILINDLKDMFYNVCSEQIYGLDSVRCSFDQATGEVQFFAMFVENCRHFNDRSMENTLLADQKTKYYSNEVKAFAKKFGMRPAADCPRDKDGKVVGEFAKHVKKNGNAPLNADSLFIQNVDRAGNFARSFSMRLSWTTLVRLIFDENGHAFQKQYNKRPSRCRIESAFVFDKADGMEFGRLRYLEVTKSMMGFNSSANTKPRIAFNYREA